MRLRRAGTHLGDEAPYRLDRAGRRSRRDYETRPWFLEAQTPAADLLLDQRIACGVGHVYKSEVLFLQRVHPLAPMETLTDQCLFELYRTAAELLRRNPGTGPRITRFKNDAAGRCGFISGRVCPASHAAPRCVTRDSAATAVPRTGARFVSRTSVRERR